MILTNPKQYWIAPNAISISLNALGDNDRIQGSVASGAVISCYIDDIKPASQGGSPENGDGLGLDNGRNPKRWPLSLSPTYFNSHTAKYVYVAIPRSTAVGTQAVVVFPSQLLDIYGREYVPGSSSSDSSSSSDISSSSSSDGPAQIGSEDYFYIWLQGIISSSGENGQTSRQWVQVNDYGGLGTYEDLITVNDKSQWYTYANNLVTFLKEIMMNNESWFRNLNLGTGVKGGTLTGVATKANAEHILDSSTEHVVTPSYLDEFGNTRYLSKIHDDTAQGIITFMQGLKLGSPNSPYGFSGSGVGHLFSLIFDKVIMSLGASKDFESGKGIYLDGEEGTIWTDGLNVRGFMRVMELIINRLQLMESDYSFTEGDTIEHVDYEVADGSPTGRLILTMKKDHANDYTPFYPGDILYAKVNDLLPHGESIPDGHTTTKNGSYYTVWMKVISRDLNANQLTVELYPGKKENRENYVPGGINFSPYGTALRYLVDGEYKDDSVSIPIQEEYNTYIEEQVPVSSSSSDGSSSSSSSSSSDSDEPQYITITRKLGDGGYDCMINVTRHGNVADGIDPDNPDQTQEQEERFRAMQEARQQSWHLSTTDQRLVYYWRVNEPIVNESNIALCLGMLPQILSSVVPTTVDWNKPSLYVSQIYYETADKIKYPARIIKEDRGEWSEIPSTVYTPETGGRWKPDVPPTYVNKEGLPWAEGVSIPPKYGELAESYAALCTSVDPSDNRNYIEVKQGDVIREPYHCKTFTFASWLFERIVAGHPSEWSDGKIEAMMFCQWKTDLEISRVWHGGKLWECLKDGTTQEPKFRRENEVQDWQPVGGDTSFKMRLVGDGGETYEGATTLPSEESGKNLTAQVLWGTEDISENVTSWRWDIIEANGTEYKGVANTQRYLFNIANMPASWNTDGYVLVRCVATGESFSVSAIIRIDNADYNAYSIEFTEYVDVITVDDVGNVIGGLWKDSGDDDRIYRIKSAINVRKNGTLMTVVQPSTSSSSSSSSSSSVDDDVPVVGKGQYAIYYYPVNCSCVVEDSTIFITGIDNIKDGVSGSTDDTNFDYEAMRAMESCRVDLVIDCEGKQSITKSFPVTIKHSSEPYVGADITNEHSGVSWNTKTQSYIGLPITFDFKMWHNNEVLDIVDTDHISLESDTEGVELVEVDSSSSPSDSNSINARIFYTKEIVEEIKNEGQPDEKRFKKARIALTGMDANLPLVTNIDVTCTALYAAVSYERTLRHTITKTTDTNVYSLLPSADEIITMSTGLSTDNLTCIVVCDSSDDKHYNLAYSELASHKIALYYKKAYTDGHEDAMETLYTETVSSSSSSSSGSSSSDDIDVHGVSIDPTVAEVKFFLYGMIDGVVDRNILHDSESVPVIGLGVDGKGVEYVFYRRPEWDGTPANKPKIYDDSHDTTPVPGTAMTRAQMFQQEDYCPYLGSASSDNPDEHYGDEDYRWTDEPQQPNENLPFEFYAQRKKKDGVWQPFAEVLLWDTHIVEGKGEESVYIRTKTMDAPLLVTENDDPFGGYIDSSNRRSVNDGYLPAVLAMGAGDEVEPNNITINPYSTGLYNGECTAKPKGISATWPYEWEVKRKKSAPHPVTGVRTWNEYSGYMSLHNRWSESITARCDASQVIVDCDSDGICLTNPNKILTFSLESDLASSIPNVTSLSVTAKDAAGNNLSGVTIITRTQDDTLGANQVKVSIPVNTAKALFEGTIKATVNGTAGATSYSRSISIPIIAKVQGESPWIADLDNEMDSVACDANGDVKSEQQLQTTLSMYYGAKAQDFVITTIRLNGGSTLVGVSSNVWHVLKGGIEILVVTFDTTTKVLTITYKVGATISNNKDLFTITLKNNAYNISRPLVFTVNGLRPGIDGITPSIYNLLPSPSQVSVSRNSSGGYIAPPTPILRCGYKKKYGTEVTTVENATAVFDGYMIYFRRRLRSSQQYEGDYIAYCGAGTATNYENARGLLASLDINTYDAVEFYISEDETTNSKTISNTTVYYLASLTSYVDKENVPVVADGKTGADGTKYQRMYKSTNSGTFGTWDASTKPADYTEGSNGWSKDRTAVNSTARYRWVTERNSNDGGTNWSDWSTPQIDTYLAEDGTSISIDGVAIAVGTRSGGGLANDDPLMTDIQTNDIVLENGTYSTADTTYWKNATDKWTAGLPDGTTVQVGQCYLVESTGHLWKLIKSDKSAGRWKDLGQIKGDPGPKGDDAITCDLDNEHEDFLYDDAGVNRSGSATSQARLYEGAMEKTNSATWSVSDDNGTSWKEVGTSTTTNATASISNAGLLTVTGLIAATVKVKVRAEYPAASGNFYYAEFTANKVKQDKYELVLSKNSVAYNPDDFDEEEIAIGATRLDISGTKSTVGFGTGATDISNASGSGTLRLFATYLGTVGGTPQAVQVTATPFAVTSQMVELNTGIYFELRKYTSASEYTIADYETVALLRSGYGTSPYIADLDNEMDSISCDDTGFPVTQQTVNTKLYLYHGVREIPFEMDGITRNGTILTIGQPSGNIVTIDAGTGVTIYFNTGTNILSVTYATTAKFTNGKDEYVITVKPVASVSSGDDEIDDSIERKLTFTVNGIIGDVYNLNPSVTQIAVDKATTIFSGLTCGYKVNINGETQAVADISDRIGGKYDIYFRRHIRAGITVNGVTGPTWENTYYLYRHNTYKGDISSFDVLHYDNVEFVLCTAEAGTVDSSADLGSIIDKETVPVVRDGSDGSSDTIIITCVPGSLTVNFDANGNLKEPVTNLLVSLSMMANGNPCTPVGVSAQSANSIRVTNVENVNNQMVISIKNQDGITVTPADVNQGIVFIMQGSYNDGTNTYEYTSRYAFPMNASFQGPDGTSPWVADIDNEMDSVFTDDGGVVQREQVVSTIASLYNGNASLPFTVESVSRGLDTWSKTELTNTSPRTKNNVEVSYNGSDREITVKYKAGAEVADKKDVFFITLKSVDDSNVTRVCKLTVNAVAKDKYDIVFTSESAISYNVTTGTPAQSEIKVRVNRTTLDGSSDTHVPPNGWKLMFCDPSTNKPYSEEAVTSNSTAIFTTNNASMSAVRVVIAKLIKINGNDEDNEIIDEDTVLDSETVPINKVANGKDVESNPNILLRTLFDKGLDFIKEKWNVWPTTGASMEVDADKNNIMGHQTLRMDSSNIGASAGVTFEQSVLGKLKPDTCYTMSFYSWASKGYSFFIHNIHNGSEHVKIYDGNVTVDGASRSISGTTNDVGMPASTDNKFAKHVITFKTGASQDISTTNLTLGFYLKKDSESTQRLILAMLKLEEGEVATAYKPNDDDLTGPEGPEGDDGKYYVDDYALSNSRELTNGTPTIYGSWSSTQPTPTPQYPFVWKRSRLYDPNTNTYGTAIYVCLTGPDGATGATGRMYYIYGKYTDREYTNNGDYVALVFFNDGTYQEGRGYGKYYYLNQQKTTNRIDNKNYAPGAFDYDTNTAYAYHSAPPAEDPVWLPANDFGVVITDGLFANFAKFGSAIFSGDWMFSQNGRIGSTEYNNGASVEQGGTVPAYTCFDSRFPYGQGSEYIEADTTNMIDGAVVSTDYVRVSKNFKIIKGIEYRLIIRAKIELEGSVPSDKRYMLVGIHQGSDKFIASINYQNGNDEDYLIEHSNLVATDTRNDAYIIMRAPTTGVKCYIRQITLQAKAGFFEPNYAVDLLTGKIVGARGNFVVNPNGSGSLAGGNISWGASGNATFQGDIGADGGNIFGKLLLGQGRGHKNIALEPQSHDGNAAIVGKQIPTDSSSDIELFRLSTDEVWGSLYRIGGLLKLIAPSSTGFSTSGDITINGERSKRTLDYNDGNGNAHTYTIEEHYDSGLKIRITSNHEYGKFVEIGITDSGIANLQSNCWPVCANTDEGKSTFVGLKNGSVFAGDQGDFNGVSGGKYRTLFVKSSGSF